ncbi:tellurite resistance TerB family protein [Synechococcus sp. BA-132 BA5]|uniref:tellurite resistance TerB family protein n=1 Tax=Synechococcus sp. BA-132 BA5 TaxID=3110252 RepID=UPI002B2080A0|nr:tellurite resistance TerB family protein [Synechococcus sp. BA-132 BA5]MEA5413554.1 tellurite resistance TerB family protein [Synechococcus sp. BA-132 BA5]
MTGVLLLSTFFMDAPTAFAAVALAAVSWDGALTMAGTRALRHALDYRAPFKGRSDKDMITLMDTLLQGLRAKGSIGLMEEAAAVLDDRQRHTAYAVAAEIMRSDGPLQAQEEKILADLATTLRLDLEETTKVLAVMDVLHASILEPAVSA